MKIFAHKHAGFYLRLNKPWSVFVGAAVGASIVSPVCFPQAVAAVVTQVISRKLWGGCPFVLLYRSCRGEVSEKDSRLYALLGRWATWALLVQPIALFVVMVACLYLWLPLLNQDHMVRPFICLGFLIGWTSRHLTTRRRRAIYGQPISSHGES